MSKILYQGAEAIITLSSHKDFIIKNRIPKSYRIKELDDKIRVQRTRSEEKLLTKASKIINASKPFFENSIKNSTKIKMPYINGKKLSDYLDNFPVEKQKEILKTIGKEVAKLHDAEIIHGDLTTSNMILVEGEKILAHLHSQINKSNNDEQRPRGLSTSINSKRSALTKSGTEQYQSASNSEHIFFIDFGLGFISKKAEDKAVDIHLLKQALEAKHFTHWEVLYEEFLKGYKTSKESEKVLERLKVVEKRGRYRH